MRYSWILVAMLVSVAASDAGAYSKAAVAACERAAEDQDDKRTIAECGNLIKEPDVPVAVRAMALSNRCVAYYYQDDDDRAFEDCNAALGLTPDDVPALRHRGLLLNERFRFDEAIKDYDRAIGLDSRDSFLYVSRGTAYYNKNELDAAVRDFDRALQIGGSDGRAYYRRANALLAKGETKRAMEDYARSVPLNAGGISGPRFAGLGAFYLGRYADAVEHFSNLSEQERDPYDAFFHYLSLRRLNRDAAKMFDGMQSRFDSWPGLLASYLQGKISKADLLKAAPNSDPETDAGQRCEAEFYIGEMELIVANKEEARQHFDTTLKICPKNFIELTGARAELSRM